MKSGRKGPKNINPVTLTKVVSKSEQNQFFQTCMVEIFFAFTSVIKIVLFVPSTVRLKFMKCQQLIDGQKNTKKAERKKHNMKKQ